MKNSNPLFPVFTSKLSELKPSQVFSIFSPAHGIPDQKKLYYLRSVLWLIWCVTAPLIIVEIIYDQFYVSGGAYAAALTRQYLLGWMLPLTIALILGYTLDAKRGYITIYFCIGGSLLGEYWLSNLADGAFTPVFLPLIVCSLIAFGFLMPIYPKTVCFTLAILFAFSFNAMTTSKFGGSELTVLWFNYWLIWGAGTLYLFMQRMIMFDMANAFLSQNRRIDELNNTNFLLSITMDENQFGFLCYDKSGQLILERGASAKRLFPWVIDQSELQSFEALNAHIKRITHIDPSSIEDGFCEIRNEKTHYLLRCHKLRDMTIISHMNITLLRQMEAELHSNQILSAIGEITSGVAHNYNNNLAIALSNLEAISIEKYPELWEKDLEPTVQAIGECADLSRKLLALSGQQHLSLETFNVSKVVYNMKPLIKTVLGTEIKLKITGIQDAYIRTDPNELEVAILSLILNAKNAIQPNAGKITIKVSANEDYYGIAISDDGHGIPPELQEKVFDPFFTTRKKQFSAGLGLSTVKGFVEQSKGYIQLQSLPDQTIFTLFFPKCAPRKIHSSEENLTPLSTRFSSDEKPRTVGEKIVMIVDDNVQVTLSYKRLLNALGFKVILENEPEKSIETYKNHPEITHVFLDLSMPNLDGVSLAKILLNIRQTPKFYLLSGETSRLQSINARELGFEEIFIKPLHAKDFKMLIEDNEVV